MTRVLIYGGREWDNQPALTTICNTLHAEYRFSAVINGGNRNLNPKQKRWYGADYQAAVWAQWEGIPVEFYYADWPQFGLAAGPRRNSRMLKVGRPDLGIEFPGDAGTRDMRGRLDGAGVQVIEAKVYLP